MAQNIMEIGIGTWIVIGLLAIGLLLAAGIWVFYRVNIAIANAQDDAYWRGRYQDHWLRMADSEPYITARVKVIHKYATAEEYDWARESMAERGYKLEHELFTDPATGFLVAEYVPVSPFLVEAREA